jgi:hypothetical protein
MTGAIASFSLLAVAARAVSPSLDTFEIMLFRSGMGLLMGGGVARRHGAPARGTAAALDIHAARERDPLRRAEPVVSTP